tara:strand:+ start:1625 stop:2650 length:1026 start_codon:yes stop_codon:yes gene_type:complete
MKPSKPSYTEIKSLLESDYPFSKDVIEYCKYTDLLNSLKNIIFPDFFEHPIHFYPTYKRNKLTGKYKLMKQKYGRLPGYADRVIIKTKYNITNYIYDSISLYGNDHLPVFWSAEILNISIATISWNVGKANLSFISPENMRIYFERFGKVPDIFIIGLQECQIKTKPNFDIWEGIYDSFINLNTKNLKNYIGKFLGFGIKTYIMYNSLNLKIKKNKSTIIGSITKSIHTISINIRKDNTKYNLVLCNLHAPFTENINRYKTFLNSAYKQINKLSMNKDLIHIMFGDLNSRSLLNINDSDLSYVVKNIHILKNSEIQSEEDLYNISKNIYNYMTNLFKKKIH